MTKLRAIAVTIILTALIVVLFGNLNYNNYQAQASHYIGGNQWDEGTCGGCHPDANLAFEDSYHMLRDEGYEAQSYWDPLFINLMEDEVVTGLAQEWGVSDPEGAGITLVFDTDDSIVGYTSTDCRICHLKGDFDWIAVLEDSGDLKYMGSESFDDIFLNVPSDDVCANRCHKVEVSLRAVMWSSDEYSAYDTHANASVSCLECHTTADHQIGRNRTVDSKNPVVYPMQQCADCHFEVTHGMYADAHLVNVSCEACHIPMLPGGQLAGGSPIYSVDWTNGIRETEYRTEDFQPVLAWFNGSVEGIPYPSNRNDTGVFLKPMNPIRVSWWDEGTDPEIAEKPNASTKWGTPIPISHVKSADVDNDGTVTIDEVRSFDADMDGMPDYPSAVVRQNDVYYSVSHNIVSNASDNAMGLTALWCDDCHGNTSRINWPLLGYEADPAETDPPTNFSSYNVTVEIIPLRPKPEEVENEPQLLNDLFGSNEVSD